MQQCGGSKTLMWHWAVHIIGGGVYGVIFRKSHNVLLWGPFYPYEADVGYR